MNGTGLETIRDIENWITYPKAPQIFWLTGTLGMGKSTIARTICSRASTNPKIVLGGSFFCSRLTGDVRCLVPTLAQHLALQSPEFGQALADELVRNPDIVDKPIKVQVEHLLYKPSLAFKNSHLPVVLVIDGLDECRDQFTVNERSNGRIISETLEALLAFSRFPVKVLVTSRPETYIHDTPVSDATFATVLQQHTLKKEQVTADIHLYVSTRLSDIPELRYHFTGDQIEKLVGLCDGQFIVAATALHYILRAGVNEVMAQYKNLLEDCRDEPRTGQATPLDHLYRLIFPDATSGDMSDTDQLSALLACLLSTRMPLSLIALSDLLGMTNNDVRARLGLLRTIVHVPDDHDQPGVCILHTSFADYLSYRAPSNFRIAESLCHETLARECLRVRAKQLHSNISINLSSCG